MIYNYALRIRNININNAIFYNYALRIDQYIFSFVEKNYNHILSMKGCNKT